MAKNGLELIVPTSVSVGGGSASIGVNGSITFSNSYLISINGIFSGDYDNYRIVGSFAGNGIYGGTLSIRMRASGADNTTSSSYVSQYFYVSGTTALAGRNGATTQAAFVGYGYSGQGFVADFYGPYLSEPTAARSITAVQDNAVTTPIIYDHGVTHNVSSAFDGFSIFTGYNPSTITGRISVYGMRK